MGYLQAVEMIDQGGIEVALSWHLSANHWPPVPAIMIPVCLAAIDAATEEEWDAEVDLPEGVSYKGRPTAPVWAIVEQHHLEPFLAQYEQDED